MNSGTYPSQRLIPVTVENIEHMQQVGSLTFSDRVTGLQFSPDGKFLAIRLDQSIVLWDTHTGKQHVSFEPHSWVEQIAFSSDGKILLVSVGSPFSSTTPASTLHYLNVETGEEIDKQTHSLGFVSALAFHLQNPNVFLLISYERHSGVMGRPNSISVSNVGIEVWENRKLIQRFTDFRAFYREGYNKLNQHLLEFHTDGKTAFVCLFTGEHSGGQVLAWEALGSGELKAVSELGECFYGLKLDRRGHYLAIGHAPAGKVTVRDLTDAGIVYTDTDPVNHPYILEFDGNGTMLVIGREPQETHRVEFDRDGTARAVESEQKEAPTRTLEMISLAGATTIRTLPSSHLHALAFSPDNTILALGTGQKTEPSEGEVTLWGIPE